MTAQKLQYPMVLTDKQYTVYRFYEIFYEKNKLYPTMEQARVALGYKRASSVQRHLMALDKLGVMTSLRGQWIITAPVALILKLPKRRIAIKYLEFPITDSPEDEKRRRAIIDYGRALGWNECIDFIDKPKEEKMKKKIQIHKNSLKDYFVKKGTYKLGKEEMVRWVDIPEYIIIESGNVDAKQIEKLEDTERGVRLGDWSSTQHYFNVLIAKINEIIEEVNK